LSVYLNQGRIQDFKLEGAHLKKIAPRGGRRENLCGISCEKSRFTPKNHIFSNIRGGGAPGAPPPGSAPVNSTIVESINVCG
jgi:hypothetical protein